MRCLSITLLILLSFSTYADTQDNATNADPDLMVDPNAMLDYVSTAPLLIPPPTPQTTSSQTPATTTTAVSTPTSDTTSTATTTNATPVSDTTLVTTTATLVVTTTSPTTSAATTAPTVSSASTTTANTMAQTPAPIVTQTVTINEAPTPAAQSTTSTSSSSNSSSSSGGYYSSQQLENTNAELAYALGAQQSQYYYYSYMQQQQAQAAQGMSMATGLVMGMVLGTVISSAADWGHPVYYAGPGYHYGPVIYHNGPVIYHYGPYGWNHPVHPIVVTPHYPTHYMSDRDIYNWDIAHPNNQIHPYQNGHPDQPIVAHPTVNMEAKPAAETVAHPVPSAQVVKPNNEIKTTPATTKIEPKPEEVRPQQEQSPRPVQVEHHTEPVHKTAPSTQQHYQHNHSVEHSRGHSGRPFR